MKISKKLKALSIALCALLSILFLTLGLININSKVAYAESVNLYMSPGASVRSSEPMGIGFITNVKKSWYDGLNGTKETGTIFLRKSETIGKTIDIDNDFKIENKNTLASQGITLGTLENNGWLTMPETEDGYYTFRGSIVELSEADSQKEFMARGYVYDGTNYYYTDFVAADHTRSLEQVAKNAYQNNASLSENQFKFLQNYTKYTVLTDGVQEYNSNHFIAGDETEILGIYNSGNLGFDGGYEGNAVEFDLIDSGTVKVKTDAKTWEGYTGGKYISMWFAVGSSEPASGEIHFNSKDHIFTKGYTENSNTDDTDNWVYFGTDKAYSENTWYKLVAPVDSAYCSSGVLSLFRFYVANLSNKDTYNGKIYLGDIKIVEVIDQTPEEPQSSYLWQPSDYNTDDTSIGISTTAVNAEYMTSEQVSAITTFTNPTAYTGDALKIYRPSGNKTNYVRVKFDSNAFEGFTRIKFWVAVVEGKWTKAVTGDDAYLINNESIKNTTENETVSNDIVWTWVCYDYEISVVKNYIYSSNYIKLLRINNTSNTEMCYLGNIELY